jgi:hypothetical protein
LYYYDINNKKIIDRGNFIMWFENMAIEYDNDICYMILKEFVGSKPMNIPISVECPIVSS